MDSSHHAFLQGKVRDFSTGKNSVIHIPYCIVDAMIEIPGASNQIGFLMSQEDAGCRDRNNVKA
jgi:hypothetical protein